MSKKYTNYSNMAKGETPEVIDEPVITETDATVELDSVVTETVETTVTVKGTVVDCEKLNVRAKPNTNGEVICVVDRGRKLAIYEGESTNDWYKVCAENGAEGYCMKKFIKTESV